MTGYSQRDKQAFTGKVSTLGADKLESIPVASIDAALQGNVAGLNITSTTGTPGATQDIRIQAKLIGIRFLPLAVLNEVGYSIFSNGFGLSSGRKWLWWHQV